MGIRPQIFKQCLLQGFHSVHLVCCRVKEHKYTLFTPGFKMGFGRLDHKCSAKTHFEYYDNWNMAPYKLLKIPKKSLKLGTLRPPSTHINGEEIISQLFFLWCSENFMCSFVASPLAKILYRNKFILGTRPNCFTVQRWSRRLESNMHPPCPAMMLYFPENIPLFFFVPVKKHFNTTKKYTYFIGCPQETAERSVQTLLKFKSFFFFLPKIIINYCLLCVSSIGFFLWNCVAIIKKTKEI